MINTDFKNFSSLTWLSVALDTIEIHSKEDFIEEFMDSIRQMQNLKSFILHFKGFRPYLTSRNIDCISDKLPLFQKLV